MYIHTHCVFQHSIDIHFPTPIPSVTHTNSLGSAQHNHNSIPSTTGSQQHTSCRGDSISQYYADSAPETPWSPYLFTEGFAFTVVILSPGPCTTNRAHRQSALFCKCLLALQSLLHSSFPPLSAPALSTSNLLLQGLNSAKLSLRTNSARNRTNTCNQE